MKGSHIKVCSFGDDAIGVRIHGNPRRPEPVHFRVHLPGGTVDITRTSEGDYWVHVIAQREDHETREGTKHEGRLVDARLHSENIHTAEMDLGDFADPGLYDVALRLTRIERKGSR